MSPAIVALKVQLLAIPVGLAQFALIAIGLYLMVGIGLNTFQATDLFWIVPILAIFMAAGLLVHEFGHLLCGVAVGLRPIECAIGPLLIEFVEKSLSIHRRRDWRHGPLAYVQMVPRHAQGLRNRLAILIAGGPLTSLLACIAMPVLLSALYRAGYSRTDGVPVFLMLAAAVSNLFYASFFSNQFSGPDQSGATLIDILMDGPNSDRVLMPYLAYGLFWNSRSGIRPRDWDPVMVERMLNCRDGRDTDLMANHLGFLHALDCQHLGEASDLLERAVEQCEVASNLRAAVMLDAAYFEGRFRGNAALARNWLAGQLNGPSDNSAVFRARAAAHLASGDLPAAVVETEHGLGALANHANYGIALAEGDWLRDILAECQHRTKIAAAPGSPLTT